MDFDENLFSYHKLSSRKNEMLKIETLLDSTINRTGNFLFLSFLQRDFITCSFSIKSLFLFSHNITMRSLSSFKYD